MNNTTPNPEFEKLLMKYSQFPKEDVTDYLVKKWLYWLTEADQLAQKLHRTNKKLFILNILFWLQLITNGLLLTYILTL
jgi:hypothetical protein